MYPVGLYPVGLYPLGLFPGAGKGASGPSLTIVAVPTAAVDGGSPVAVTATLAGVSGSIATTLAGGGSIDSSAPTSGVAFHYTAPSGGSGSAVIDATGPGGLHASVTIPYGPLNTFTFNDGFNLLGAYQGRSGLTLIAQFMANDGSTTTPPFTSRFFDRGNGAYLFTTPLPAGTVGWMLYRDASAPTVDIAFTVISPPQDPPGVTAILALLANSSIIIVPGATGPDFTETVTT